MGAGPNDKGSSRGHIMDSIEQSLERLQTNYIDLYQIHGTDSATPVEETLRALDDLVSRGLVRYIGVSNWQAWRMAKSLGRSEEHTSELQSLMRISYAVFCLKKKKYTPK